eukprot:3502509-Prymnesium_polylepis.1
MVVCAGGRLTGLRGCVDFGCAQTGCVRRCARAASRSTTQRASGRHPTARAGATRGPRSLWAAAPTAAQPCSRTPRSSRSSSSARARAGCATSSPPTRCAAGCARAAARSTTRRRRGSAATAAPAPLAATRRRCTPPMGASRPPRRRRRPTARTSLLRRCRRPSRATRASAGALIEADSSDCGQRLLGGGVVPGAREGTGEGTGLWGQRERMMRMAQGCAELTARGHRVKREQGSSFEPSGSAGSLHAAGQRDDRQVAMPRTRSPRSQDKRVSGSLVLV